MLTHFVCPEELQKKQAKQEIKRLQKKLATLQQQVKEANLPVMILIDGWSAAGKGSMIGQLTAQMEPRGSSAFASTAPVGEECRKPFLWRYWRDIPAGGEVTIFDRGWYRDVLEEMEDKDKHTKRYVQSIHTFERQLVDDGCLVLKFFLHIGQAEQKRRLEELADSKATSWRVTRAEWWQNKHYEEVFALRERLLNQTNTASTPWQIIWNESEHTGVCLLLRAVCAGMEEALAHGVQSKEASAADWVMAQMPQLAEVDLGQKVGKEDYQEILKEEQKELQHLHSLIYREKRPVVIAFEGWDAAGKGGAIRRLSWSLDPRGHAVSSIAAPTGAEKNHHYLWRFWNRIPKDGHIAIFDRTWYGRVLVERVEGYASAERVQMAYQEINEFERELSHWGAVVLKFWLQIDAETQLERFTLRQNNPEKQYKITDEDWRNREKWPLYEQAVNDMLQKTSTEHAKWTIVEANDKKYARLKVLRTVREALEEALQ